MKKTAVLLLVLSLILLSLTSCLHGRNPRTSKVVYSENSCWKAEQVNMVLFFSDNGASYITDHGLGSYKFIDSETRYFNGKLTYDETEYYLVSDMNDGGGLIFVDAYVKNQENDETTRADTADFVLRIIDNNHIKLKLFNSDFLTFPQDMEIDLYRIEK